MAERSDGPFWRVKTLEAMSPAEDKIPEYAIDVREIIPSTPARDKLGRKTATLETIVVLRPRRRVQTDPTRLAA